MSNFLKRFLTSLVLVPILFFGIFKGEYIFLLFVTLVIIVSFNELSKIIINKDSGQLLLGYIVTLSIPIASYIDIELFININSAFKSKSDESTYFLEIILGNIGK